LKLNGARFVKGLLDIFLVGIMGSCGLVYIFTAILFC